MLDLARLAEEVVGAQLFRDLVRYVHHACGTNNAIKVIGAWAFTEDGRDIAEKIGMEKVHEFEDYANTGFYELTTERLFTGEFAQSALLRSITTKPFFAEYSIGL